MADVSKLKRRTMGAPPPPTEASTNLVEPETPNPELHGGSGDVPGRASPALAEARIDGRSLRRSNRIIQFATRVTPEFDRRIRNIAMRDGLLIVEVLERALDIYESKSKDSR